MRYLLLFFISCLIFLGCKKDKITTTPQLKYKSVNSTVIQRGGLLTFTFDFSDAEGDQDLLYIKSVSKCSMPVFDTVIYSLPSVSNVVEGEVTVTFENSTNNTDFPTISPSCDFDTTYFRFVLKDQAGHISDTVNAETIVLIKNL